MLEVEIQKLTAVVAEMTLQLKATNALLMEARTNAKITTETPAEKSYREDDAARVEMQRKRDEAAANFVEAKASKKASSKKADEPVLDQGPAQDKQPVEPEPVSHITAEDLKTVAMELVRADSSARDSIVQILADHNSKTIPHLDPKHYNSVHGALLKLAMTVYNESEAV